MTRNPVFSSFGSDARVGSIPIARSTFRSVEVGRSARFPLDPHCELRRSSPIRASQTQSNGSYGALELDNLRVWMIRLNRAADNEFGPSNADPIVDTVGGVRPRCVTVGKFEAPAEMVDRNIHGGIAVDDCLFSFHGLGPYLSGESGIYVARAT